MKEVLEKEETKQKLENNFIQSLQDDKNEDFEVDEIEFDDYSY